MVKYPNIVSSGDDQTDIITNIQESLNDNEPPNEPSSSKSDGDFNSMNPKKKKHNCRFCDQLVNNFARHMERQHNDEFQVQEFLSLKKSDPLRKQLINKLRREGDFCAGNIIPVQRKQSMVGKENEICQFLPCTHCKGNSYLISLYTNNLNF